MRWVSYYHKGASHDSSSLRETHLYKKKLQKIKNKLHIYDLYTFGDSTYSPEQFLMTTYLQPVPKSAKDTSNFYYSRTRITVECVFGDIDLMWYIFWKRIMWSLDHTALIIEGTMCLHNVLVDYRDGTTAESDLYTERNIFETEISDTDS